MFSSIKYSKRQRPFWAICVLWAAFFAFAPNLLAQSGITVSGKVPLERYTELFNYFITPFAMTGNKIEIEVNFKIKSTTGSPIDETKQQYKSAKEAAKQLGLNFEEEL